MKWLKQVWDLSLYEPRYRIAAHAGFWSFLFIFWTRESVTLQIDLKQHFSVTLVSICFALFLFYPLVYFIVPLYQQRKWFWAIIASVAYYVLAVLLRSYNIQLIVNWYNLKQTWVVGRDFWDHLYKSQIGTFHFFRTIFSSIPSLLDVIYVPLTLKFIRYAYRFNMERARLQLHTLKAQINPHFFFNTLNNLQSFIVQNEQQRSIELLDRLGNFMRTSLYDCDAETITMAQETQLLNNYIGIERVRFEDTADIRVSLADEDPQYQVPPFLFLPFIENVFKHGSGLPSSEISISIQLVSAKDRIRLTTINRFHPSAASQAGGIGISNVKKRLAHYFPGRHRLEILQHGDVFELTLEIDKT